MVTANATLDLSLFAAGVKTVSPESSLDSATRSEGKLLQGALKVPTAVNSAFYATQWTGQPSCFPTSRCAARATVHDGRRQQCRAPPRTRTRKLPQHRSGCYVCNSLPPNLPDTTQESSTGNEKLIGGNGAADLKGKAGLHSLDSYLSKLEQEGSRPSGTDSTASAASMSAESTKKLTKDQEALKKLDAYFDMLNPKVEEPQAPPAAPEPSPEPVRASVQDLDPSLRSRAPEGPPGPTPGPTPPTSPPEYSKDVEDELDYLVEEYVRPTIREVLEEAKEEEIARAPFENWLTVMEFQNPPVVVNMLVAINIAVYLLELATRNIGTGEFVMSLPNIYMSKVNGLIVGGEWWRIVTPMFLHDGFLHLLCGSWALLSLGPRVEGALGSPGFLAVYLLSGLFGNLFSFVITPDPTVGATGPVYGIVGAWVAFLYRNQQAIDEGIAQDAAALPLVVAVINIVLPVGLPVDTWTHIGGALGGALLGAVSSPRLVRVTSSSSSALKEERVENEVTKPANAEGKVASSTGRKEDKFQDMEADLSEYFYIMAKRVIRDDLELLETDTRLINVKGDFGSRLLGGSLCFGLFVVLFLIARSAGVDDLLYPTWSLL